MVKPARSTIATRRRFGHAILILGAFLWFGSVVAVAFAPPASAAVDANDAAGCDDGSDELGNLMANDDPGCLVGNLSQPD